MPPPSSLVAVTGKEMSKDADGSDLPFGVRYIKKGSKVNPYHAHFTFKGEMVYVGTFPTSALASQAVERKRVELGVDLEESKKRKKRDLPRKRVELVVDPPIKRGSTKRYKKGKERDLPQGVSFDKGSKRNPCKAYFKHGGKLVHVGYCPTPDLAFEAVNKKRAELDLAPYEWTGTTRQGATPLPDLPDKEERDLPQGVYLVISNKTNPFQAYFRHGSGKVNVGYYPTPDLAFEAVNKKRAELDRAPYEWTGTTPQGVTPLPKSWDKEDKGSKTADRGLPQGVCFDKRRPNPYQASFKHKGKTVYVGYYLTPDLAFEALNNSRATVKLAPVEWTGTANKTVKTPPELRTPEAEPARKKRKKTTWTDPFNGES